MKAMAEERKQPKQKIAENCEMSKKRKAGNADEDAIALASSFSQKELEKMVADE